MFGIRQGMMTAECCCAPRFAVSGGIDSGRLPRYNSNVAICASRTRVRAAGGIRRIVHEI